MLLTFMEITIFACVYLLFRIHLQKAKTIQRDGNICPIHRTYIEMPDTFTLKPLPMVSFSVNIN